MEPCGNPSIDSSLIKDQDTDFTEIDLGDEE